MLSVLRQRKTNPAWAGSATPSSTAAVDSVIMKGLRLGGGSGRRRPTAAPPRPRHASRRSPPAPPDSAARPRSSPSSRERHGSAEVGVKRQPKHRQVSPEALASSVSRSNSKFGGAGGARTHDPGIMSPML